MGGVLDPVHSFTKALTKINMYKISWWRLRGGRGPGLSGKLTSFSSSPGRFRQFRVRYKAVQKIKDVNGFQRNAAVTNCSQMSQCQGSHDFVGQVVTERSRNGQGLHLLGRHHPTERHPAHVLQTGDATRTLPEVNATITSPKTYKGRQVKRSYNFKAL